MAFDDIYVVLQNIESRVWGLCCPMRGQVPTAKIWVKCTEFQVPGPGTQQMNILYPAHFHWKYVVFHWAMDDNTSLTANIIQGSLIWSSLSPPPSMPKFGHPGDKYQIPSTEFWASSTKFQTPSIEFQWEDQQFRNPLCNVQTPILPSPWFWSPGFGTRDSGLRTRYIVLDTKSQKPKSGTTTQTDRNVISEISWILTNSESLKPESQDPVKVQQSSWGCSWTCWVLLPSCYV